MRTPRFLTAAAAAAITITALAGCANTAGAEKAPQPDGHFDTPLTTGTQAVKVFANWVRLPDGRKVLCISDNGGGGSFDCNWDDIRPKDAK